MLCALTVRTIKPGTFDEFRRAFLGPIPGGARPEGFVRFTILHNVENPDEVITFGFYDGTVEEARAAQQRFGITDQHRAIEPYVESVVTEGLYEAMEEYTG
jgi:heme-degrading monooxygenase HmoA